jgi:hypothetical protein
MLQGLLSAYKGTFFFRTEQIFEEKKQKIALVGVFLVVSLS